MALPTRFSSTWVRRRASPLPTGSPCVTFDVSGKKFIIEAKEGDVEIKAETPWTDGGISVPPGGFSAAFPPSWYHRILLALVVPLRRETTQDWFHVVLRYGSVGGEEDFIEPDPDDYKLEAVIKPKRSGEVFVFVNDAVIGIPGLYNLFYRGNKGTATLTITPK